MHDTDLKQMEETAYRESYSDGLVDLFAGASLIWIGACWLWFESLAPFAAIIPAALSPALIPLRRGLVESRVGYVRWTAPRRAWEQRQRSGLLALGVAMLALAIIAAASLMSDGGLPEASSLAAAIPAVLVVIPTVLLAAVTGLRRLWGYAFVIVAAAALTVVTTQNPGWPLLIGGVVMVLTGLTLFMRFLRLPAGDER